MIPEGKYKARGVEGALAETSQGNPQVAVLVRITEGEHAGEEFTWYGHFTEKTEVRTLESLRHLGWETDDLTDLRGIDANEVQIVIGHEEDQEGRMRPRVKWINAAGAGLAIKERMDAAAARAFAARMKGAAIASRQKSGGGQQRQQAPQSRGSYGQGRGGYGPPDEPSPFDNEPPF